jgi:PKHD-type hydroxylase
MTQEKIEQCSPSWLWRNALPPEICDFVWNTATALEEQTGVTGVDGDVTPLRNSNVRWMPTNSIIEGVLYNHGLYANMEAGWFFNVGRPERVQVATYDVDQHYGWHVDWAPLAKFDSVRKITIVALLNDPSEFEGGGLEIEGEGVLQLERGDIVAFPSFLQHRVVPVTKGKRISAVCWINGPRTL